MDNEFQIAISGITAFQNSQKSHRSKIAVYKE